MEKRSTPIPPLPRYRLLFVCLGNICRSPAAEAVMRHLAETRDLADLVICDSAGTIDFHAGNGPDRRMMRAAAARGIGMGGLSRSITGQDFSTFDLILTMDHSNYHDVLAVAPDAVAAKERVVPMMRFSSIDPDGVVPDPYYGGDSGFDEVLDLLTDACGRLLDELDTAAARE